MNKILLVDLDGTICNCDHRRAFVRTQPPNWDAFNAACANDTPHSDIIWLLKTLTDAGCICILVSGRSDEFKQETIKWLSDNNVVYTELFMRKAKDSRADNIIKMEILEEIRKKYGEPFMSLDDRDSVVSAWRKAGVRCLQVAPGDF